MKLAQNIADSSYLYLFLQQVSLIEFVAFTPGHRNDFLRYSARPSQIPTRSSIRHQTKVRVLAQLNIKSPKRLLCCSEVPSLGIDKNSVMVPEKKLTHTGDIMNVWLEVGKANRLKTKLPRNKPAHPNSPGKHSHPAK